MYYGAKNGRLEDYSISNPVGLEDAGWLKILSIMKTQ
jgi:hypothetical protein